MNKKAAITFLRTKRHTCGTSAGNDCNTNECQSNPCQNGGNCQDFVNRYECTCAPGYTGTNCETEIDECQNIDECQSNPCLNGAQCQDNVNNYVCSCNAGYVGTNCETEINECQSNPCQNGGQCQDLVNRYNCTCVAGYTATNCETEIDECQSNPCQNGAQCQNHLNSYSCRCSGGYVGTNCETDVDECQSNPCQNQATCENQINKYTCNCKAGFLGTNCETEIDECQSNPCLHGAQCEDFFNKYNCVCVPGYKGINCETDIDECHSNPCQNGGHCNDLVNMYTCTCIPGYTGTHCEAETNECLSNPCQNGGSCDDLFNRYQCYCIPGYTGTNCETDIDECASSPCQNQGTCNNLIDKYTCDCSVRYNGTICEKDCRPGPADILFIIDISHSSKSVFNKTLNFVDTFLRRLPIGQDDFQMAALAFSNAAELIFDFDDYSDISSLRNAFHSMNMSLLTTYTNKALDLARNVLLDPSNGWRQNVAKYIILLYDGLSTKRRETFDSRQKIVYGLSGTTLLTVGIGKLVDQIELSGVASSPRYVFSSINDDALNNILRETSHFDCDDCIENTDTDLLLMFDISNSQRITELQSLQNVAEELINYLDIDTNKNIKISIVGFAESTETFLSFSELTSNNHLKGLIQTLSPVSQKCDLAFALKHARFRSFTTNNGARSGVTRKIVIIFSNAKWINHNAGIEEANKLKAEGVTLINIGVDLDTDVDKLIDIASDPYYVYLILDHQTEQLKVIATETMPTICKKDIFQIRV
ncbi:hypothetical protein KUTeg_009436 [Tegillarca granosa]|uniref:Uncharacterized protein n=1 Tax=Tegillarca granosa TaxID=220873 RepID=A0ABQ9F3V9_TEGGR|nr:hypothetical protein KUTeg_009436 [Tegillarca granosa]